MKKSLAAFLATANCLLYGCSSIVSISPIESIKAKRESKECLKIITTDKLLYYMVEDIVKDMHFVDYILKTEDDQWKFNVNEESLAKVGITDLFIYHGTNHKPYSTKLIEELRKRKVGIVNTSRGVKLVCLSNPLRYKRKDISENPYYWLNPEDCKIALSNIKNSIQERDPKNRELYEANYGEATKEIDKYIAEAKNIRDEIKKCTFITVGDKFDYLARFYDVKVIKLNDYLDDSTNAEVLHGKLSEGSSYVFLYDKDVKLQKYEDIVNRYNMTPLKLIAYSFDMKHTDMFKYNLGELMLYLQKHV